MSLNRLMLSVFAALFSIVTPSLASASDLAAPIAYPAWNGCGNCALRGVYPALPVPYKTYSPDTVWVPATTTPMFRASRARTTVAMPFTIRPI